MRYVLTRTFEQPEYYRRGEGWQKKTDGHSKKSHYSVKSCGKFTPPMNSFVKCSLGVCVATCRDNYQFDGGETSLSFQCKDGHWVGSGTLTECKPSCFPDCQNGGRCVSPNICQCAEHYFGPYCQYEKKPCSHFPPTPLNAHKVCTSESCTIGCSEGHQFFDGSSVVTVICRDGEWRPARTDWTSVPDCQGICDPPCQHGGVCYGFNVCQCPQEFRGRQCQYAKETCDVRKLGFNGNYNCTGDEESWTCRLTCPQGMAFSRPPATTYTCLYQTGVFSPPHVPTCVFDKTNEDEELMYLFSETSAPVIKQQVVIHESNRTSKYQLESEETNRKTVVKKKKKPTHRVCVTWKKDHFKTFDGSIFSMKSNCAYNLLRTDDNSLVIQRPVVGDCQPGDELCSYITIFVNDEEYKLFVNGHGKTEVRRGSQVTPIPAQLPGVRMDLGHNSVTATFLTSNTLLTWDLKDVVEIREGSWNKSRGLCGGRGEYSSLEEYASSSRALAPGEICQEKIPQSPPCSDVGVQQHAQEFCSVLLNEGKFKNCHDVVSPKEYYEACVWDYCSCEDEKAKGCGCEALATYVAECRRYETQISSWRNANMCGVKCSGGRVYTECGKEARCGGVMAEGCEEGCFCPPGTFVHNDSCIPLESCPCSLRGREFPPGTSLPNDCNNCVCKSGKWVCTTEECWGECMSVGDPHYRTFDRRTYDYMGKCSYYLLKMANYSIEAENIPCEGSISQNLGFSSSHVAGTPSCTKTVTVRTEGAVIKLKQKNEVDVNDKEVRLPVSLKHIYISQISSIFVLVELDDGVEVWWDGVSSVYIRAPPRIKGKTKGLCGTFNGSQKDDFLTPEGDVEQDPTSFANKWRVKESCENTVVKESDPCETNIQNKAEAEKYCAKLTGHLFLDCHFHVDPLSYYKSCLFDMCSCSRKPGECFCPIVAAYARECAAHGISIDWRPNIRECGIQCGVGEVYEVCGKRCSRSCEEISRGKECAEVCLEGCTCPPGYVYDHHSICIPTSECPCQLNGLHYPAGHADIRPSSKGLQLCTCKNAFWDCELADEEALKKYPNNSLEEVRCSSTKNQEYTHCEPPEPVTCKNMGSPNLAASPSICFGGCVCKKGYVLDSLSGECVKPAECPCHHGGRSYSDGDRIQEDCNTCLCKKGKWECSNEDCPGSCAAWGESHFRTFDDKLYDFQGTCDYILAKGALSKLECFSVTIQMSSCSSSGISCPKSVQVSAGSTEKKEIVTLAEGKCQPSNANFTRMSVREAGQYLFVEIPEMGIVVQWDRASWIYIRLLPHWKGKVSGLCGNYNGDSGDDFTSPSGGISEVSPQIFGDSWKLHDYCPVANLVTDSCKLYPQRKAWSVEKCSVLKSDLFKPCHSEVPLDFYLEKCIFDSCACDQGGDCECLCTAVAVYAHECNARGVHIKWRKQDFCPIQCDETCATYSPCISTCPPETCDDYLNNKVLSKMCKQDVCIEGCKAKPCPEGEIYKNSNLSECVPVATCKPLCLAVDGVNYYEGDLMEGDDCHSCHCSRGKKICQGVPCKAGDSARCVPGWSPWVNSSPRPAGKANFSDIEPLTTFTKQEEVSCKVEQMTDIHCRTVGTHQSPKETGEDVECSLERGLVCAAPCSDYEIQVHCQCEVSSTVATSSEATIPFQTTTPTKVAAYSYPVSTKAVSKETPTSTTASPVFYTSTTITSTEKSVCGEGEVWDECAVECDKLCLYYEYTLYESGVCLFGRRCTPGCRPEYKASCGEGYRWLDKDTCIKIEDCPCRSYLGKIVKPGGVVEESECKLCQCVGNQYTCEESCPPSSTSPPTSLPSTVIITSTVTPPPDTCPINRLRPLLEDLPDSAFTASSVSESTIYAPENAKINSLYGNWRPGRIDEKQYLQIDLGQVDVVYALSMKGDLVLNYYVTRYYVLYSLDNVAYSFVTLHGKPQEFFGPSFHLEGKLQLFSQPFEARYIRVNPAAWFGAPSVKLELMGCALSETTQPATSEQPTTLLTTSTFPPTTQPTNPPTTQPTNPPTTQPTNPPTTQPTNPPTTQPTSPTTPKVCLDKMSHHMNDQQISASSSLREPLLAVNVSVYGDYGWVPLTSDPQHWFQFDFLGERELTGVMVGGSGFKLTEEIGPAWVTSFHISYSHDAQQWNPVLDQDGAQQLFSGNVDNTNVKTIMLRMPIRGRYLRLIPTHWQNRIALRAQALGCYEPYPIIPLRLEKTTTPAPDCGLCPGATLTSMDCPCTAPLLWDGERCTTRSQCPCFQGFIAYPVGTGFENEVCEKCICVLNGIAQCQKKGYCTCPVGLRGELTASCSCICKPCPPGTRLCPTSLTCINETSWCDGVADCPDDELFCRTTPPSTTTLPSTTTTPSPALEPCPPPPVCKPGAVLERVKEEKAPFWSPFGSKSKWGSYFKGNPRERKGFGGRHKGAKKSKTSKTWRKPHVEICDKYICSCSEKPTCPPGTKLEIVSNEGGCDEFNCVTPPDKSCLLAGRTITTFDGVEYKYDICDHIIAEDILNNDWQIRAVKTCQFIGPCEKHLLISYDNHTIRLNVDQSIEFDGYAYTVPQMQKIGSQNQEFAMKQVNNKFTIFSSRLGFSIVWDSSANVKVVVPGTSVGEVSGLCGFMDDNPSNDKKKPNGELARTSMEFGDSWAKKLDCEANVCPPQVQKEAIRICQAIKEKPLSECGSKVNLEKLESQCLETICACADHSNSTEECRCDALLKAATHCQGVLPNLDLSSWRIENDCPVECENGLVFKDCFKRTCEPCCSELLTPDACPETSECFPGCYCPDGYVRNGQECVKPSTCRDCICEGYGGSRFLTFDKLDYKYSGNCTHLLAATLKSSPGPQFKVLLKNGRCDGDPQGSCFGKIVILYKEHYILAENKGKSLLLSVDGEVIDLPKKEKWLVVTETIGKGININLPKIELDLEITNGGRNYKLKLPSHFYADRTEGLCGSCNMNITDDMKMRDGGLTENVNHFGESWQEKDLPSVLGKEEDCSSRNTSVECSPLSKENDKCLILMDHKLFGKCHAVVDPTLFVEKCREELCGGSGLCEQLELYARECQGEGLCVKWRSSLLCPFNCPQGMEYEACGFGCTETCDNYELYRKSPEKCLLPRGDSCRCPKGQVVKNGTCVEERKCSPCDREGHYPGDEWRPDSCTLCTCTSSSVDCQRTQCLPSQPCPLGSKAVTLPGTQTDCCPQQICVAQIANDTCPVPQKIKCGMDQILKLEKTKYGCEDFICCCKPKEECKDVSEEMKNMTVEAGIVAVIDDSGCCPFVNKTCKPETCPRPECPEFYILVEKGRGVCCPIYECEIPANHCIYEFTRGDDKIKGTKTLKPVGEVWNDGPCLSCECRPGSSTPSCREQFCQSPPESDNYQYEPTQVNGKCCPIYKRIACRVDGHVYQIGETWASKTDPCKSSSCIIGSNGEVLKEDSVQSCNKVCKKGFEYVEAAVGECCGECKPIGCVVNGTLYLPETVWKSEDNCTSFTCLLVENSQVNVVRSEESCPRVDDCPKENLYTDRCCVKCNKTAPLEQGTCTPEPLPLNDTVRLVQEFDPERGPCANIEPIIGFTECKGICDSFTEFDWRSGQHESSCSCCQPETFNTVDVSLACADGSVLVRQTPVPLSCSCLACQSAPAQKSTSKKSSSKKSIKSGKL